MSFLTVVIVEIQNTLPVAFILFMAAESFFTIFPVAESLTFQGLVHVTCHQCAIKAVDRTFRVAVHNPPGKVNLTNRTFGIKDSVI